MSEITLSNEFIKVKMTKKPKCYVELEIWVEPPATKAAYLKAIQNVKKEISIPGFRKGRAPDAFILDKYESAVQSEFKDVVLQTAGNEALELANLYPIKNGAYRRPTIKEINKEKGAHFILEFEAQPVVPQIDFSKITIPSFQPKIPTEEDRQKAIDNFKQRFMVFDEISDRSLQENDYIDLDLTIEKEKPEIIAENKRFWVTKDIMPQLLLSALIGKNKGDTIEGVIPASQETEVSYPFHGKINAIYKGTLPAFDDALAKQVGVDTAEELQSKLFKQVNDRFYEESKDQYINQVISQLLETFPIDLPQTYIDAYRNAYIEDYKKKIHAAGSDEKIIDSHPEWIEQIEKMGIDRLRVNILFSGLKDQYDIVVSEDDLSREFLHQIGLLQMGLGELEPSDLYQLKENQSELAEKLQRIAIKNKIKDLLIDQTNLTK